MRTRPVSQPNDPAYPTPLYPTLLHPTLLYPTLLYPTLLHPTLHPTLPYPTLPIPPCLSHPLRQLRQLWWLVICLTAPGRGVLDTFSVLGTHGITRIDRQPDSYDAHDRQDRA
jgi:hypothetical protein